MIQTENLLLSSILLHSGFRLKKKERKNPLFFRMSSGFWGPFGESQNREKEAFPFFQKHFVRIGPGQLGFTPRTAKLSGAEPCAYSVRFADFVRRFPL